MRSRTITVVDVRPDRTGWPAVEATRVGLAATHPECRSDWRDLDGHEVTLRCGGFGPDAAPERLREWARDCFAMWDEGIDCAILPAWPDRAGARTKPCRSGWCGLPDHPRWPYFHLVSIRLLARMTPGFGP